MNIQKRILNKCLGKNRTNSITDEEVFRIRQHDDRRNVAADIMLEKIKDRKVSIAELRKRGVSESDIKEWWNKFGNKNPEIYEG